MKVLLALALMLSIPLTSLASLDTRHFTLRTLSSFEFSMRFSKAYPKTDTEEVLDPALTAMMTPVEYTGFVRALSPEKKKLIARVARDVLRHGEVAQLYENEIEVREAGLSYWVAVQKEVFPHLANELKAGSAMRIYYHFAGVAQGHQPVYLMIEFDSPTHKNSAG